MGLPPGSPLSGSAKTLIRLDRGTANLYLLPTGFASGEDFFSLLRDGFNLLWEEGARCPKMMSVGLHGRISGHPARAMALARFLDYVQSRDQVWICRREEIAQHWIAEHPAEPR